LGGGCQIYNSSFSYSAKSPPWGKKIYFHQISDIDLVIYEDSGTEGANYDVWWEDWELANEGRNENDAQKNTIKKKNQIHKKTGHQ
jgi:hypothetical protein